MDRIISPDELDWIKTQIEELPEEPYEYVDAVMASDTPEIKEGEPILVSAREYLMASIYDDISVIYNGLDYKIEKESIDIKGGYNEGFPGLGILKFLLGNKDPLDVAIQKAISGKITKSFGGFGGTSKAEIGQKLGGMICGAMGIKKGLLYNLLMTKLFGNIFNDI